MNGKPKRRPLLAGSPSPPLPGKAAKKRVKRQIRAEFSAAVKEPALKAKVAAAWASQEPLEHEAVTLDPAPFPHCVIPDFIPNEDFLEELQRELLSLDFHENRIVGLTQPNSCFVPDTLLCHDDELEGRRIAFILYLVPPWEKQDGGTLDLFCTDVVSKEKCRLSVSGWFHGPSVARPPRHVEPRIPRSPHVPRDHEILYDWINPAYLDMDSQTQIQEEFEDRSEMLLKDFLKRDKYQLVCKALKTEGLSWSSRGPPNKRRKRKEEERLLKAHKDPAVKRKLAMQIVQRRQGASPKMRTTKGMLLTVNPEANCLALVYRDRETLKFVKYVNQRSLEQTPEPKEFWDFSFVYYE
ncbi:2-oxoglutarate and iron-dependent oxygenase domain-containing protein 1, partial [Ophiophagus hannah]